MVALAIGITAAAGGAGAQSAGAKAAAVREQNFKQIGSTFKAIRDELGKGSPNAAAVKASATKLNAHAAQLPTWFPSGSGPEGGIKTDAKPQAWSDAAGFATAAKGFQTETGKFLQLANAGDMNGAKAQVRNLGGACKACHDKYRVPQD